MTTLVHGKFSGTFRPDNIVTGNVNCTGVTIPNLSIPIATVNSLRLVGSPSTFYTSLSASPLQSANILIQWPSVPPGAGTFLAWDSVNGRMAWSVVTSVGNIIPGNGIQVSGSVVSVANTTVVAGSYTNANITVNARGQLTAVTNGMSGQASNPRLTDISNIDPTTVGFLGTDGSNIVKYTPSATLTSIGGQQLNANLTDISNITPGSSANYFLTVNGAGTNIIAESPLSALTNIGAQPLSANLTTLSGLTPVNGNYIGTVGGAFANRTPVQVLSDIGAQAINARLTDITNINSAISDTYLATDGVNIIAQSASTVLSTIGAQATSSKLTDISALPLTNSNFVGTNGTNIVSLSPATALANIGAVPLSGGTMTGSLSLGANQLTLASIVSPATYDITVTPSVGYNMVLNSTPTQANHVITKGYADTIASGYHPIAACKAKNTTILNATYVNGVLGVGASLTSNDLTILSMDGYTPQLNDRLLIQVGASGTTSIDVGIYYVAIVTPPWQLIRTTDFDTPAQMVAGTQVFITEGTQFSNTSWAFLTNPTITIGTTPLSFTQSAGQGSSAGTGILVSGNQISIDATGVLAGSYNYPNITINGQGQVVSITANTLSSIGAQPATQNLTDISGASLTSNYILSTDGSNIVFMSPTTILSNIGAQPTTTQLNNISAVNSSINNTILMTNGSAIVAQSASYLLGAISAQPLNGRLTDISSMPLTNGYFLRQSATNVVASSPSQVLSDIGAQPSSLNLLSVTNASPTATYMLGGDGSNLVMKSPAQVRSDIGAVNISGDTMTGNLSVGTNNITCGSITSIGDLIFDTPNGNLVSNQTPTQANHLVNKNYADSLLSANVIHPSVIAKTNGTTSGDYDNGMSGIGATLSYPGSGPTTLTVDGYVIALGERVLVDADGIANGVYICTVATPWQLTRSTDFDGSNGNDLVAGASFYITSGVTFAASTWSMITTGTITLGVTVMQFTQSSGNGVSAGTGITVTGSMVSISSVGTSGSYNFPNITFNNQGQAVAVTGNTLSSIGAQPSSVNLTTLSGLTPVNGSYLGSSGGAFSIRSPAQVLSDIGAQAVNARLTDITNINASVADTYLVTDGTNIVTQTSSTVLTNIGAQPLNLNLTTLSGLTPVNGNYLGASGGAFSIRSPAQVLGDIGAVNIAGDTMTGDLSIGSGTGTLTAATITAPSDLTLNPVGNVVIPAAPTQPTHAVNKLYVDNLSAGFQVKQSVTVKSVGALSLLSPYTYNNGASGVGATITADVNNVTLVLDGYTALLNDRVLLNNETDQAYNGIYAVTQLANVGVPFILTRTVDFDNSPTGEIVSGAFSWIANGNINYNSIWMCMTTITGINPSVVGTASINFTQFQGSGNTNGFLPIGAVAPYFGTSAPSGYLLCDGSLYTQSAYPVLYAVLSGTGGTFNVPDLRAMFVRGLDAGRGIDTGRVLGSQQAGTVGPHTHPINDPGHLHNTDVSSGIQAPDDSGGGGYPWPVPGQTATNTTGISVLSNGGTETRPINVAANYIIRAV
jgi:hypothetical protein